MMLNQISCFMEVLQPLQAPALWGAYLPHTSFPPVALWHAGLYTMHSFYSALFPARLQGSHTRLPYGFVPLHPNNYRPLHALENRSGKIIFCLSARPAGDSSGSVFGTMRSCPMTAFLTCARGSLHKQRCRTGTGAELEIGIKSAFLPGTGTDPNPYFFPLILELNVSWKDWEQQLQTDLRCFTGPHFLQHGLTSICFFHTKSEALPH